MEGTRQREGERQAAGGAGPNRCQAGKAGCVNQARTRTGPVLLETA